MAKTTNSKRIFAVIRSLEKSIPSLDILPPSANRAIEKASGVESLIENLWEAFHLEDSQEGFEKMKKKGVNSSPSSATPAKEARPVKIRKPSPTRRT
jgi:hypothetical protein